MGANTEKQERARQAALKQALCREVNERRPESGEDADVIGFVCECSDAACEELVSLTIDEYEFIRRVPIRLVVRPGHVHHESERVVVEEPGRFLVIEKFGPSGEVVAHLDPRGPERRRSRASRSGCSGAEGSIPLDAEDSVCNGIDVRPDVADGTLTSARRM